MDQFQWALEQAKGPQAKAAAIPREKAWALVKFAVLLGVATLAPLLQFQIVTGPLVNAMLFIAVVLLGVRSAILIGLFPSIIALSVGLLPAVLAPMVPFIMVANTILILIFGYLWERNFFGGVVAASIIKFLFLWGTSSIVINLLFKQELAANVAAILSWPQLLTALGGGVLAFIFLKSIKRI
jgi:hypothetical protein